MRYVTRYLLVTCLLLSLRSPRGVRSIEPPAPRQTYFEQTDLGEGDDEDEALKTPTVAILHDRSLSMDLLGRDGRPRRESGLRQLEQALGRIPATTKVMFANFNEGCDFLDNTPLRLTAQRRRAIMSFARKQLPEGNTGTVAAVRAVLHQCPRLDTLVLITDGRAKSRRQGEQQRAAIESLARRFKVELGLVLVD
jgi:hypothetical protein